MAFAAERGSAAILPDDRRRNRLPRCAIPEHDGLALVRQADRRQFARLDARLRQRLGHDFADGAPDLGRVVLDPTGLRVILSKLAGHAGDALAAFVENRRPRAGGPLINGEDGACVHD